MVDRNTKIEQIDTNIESDLPVDLEEMKEEMDLPKETPKLSDKTRDLIKKTTRDPLSLALLVSRPLNLESKLSNEEVKEKYKKVGTQFEINFQGNRRHEMDIGLAEILPPDVLEVEVTLNSLRHKNPDLIGKTINGRRRTDFSRVGYYSGDDYIRIYTGDIVTVKTVRSSDEGGVSIITISEDGQNIEINEENSSDFGIDSKEIEFIMDEDKWENQVTEDIEKREEYAKFIREYQTNAVFSVSGELLDTPEEERVSKEEMLIIGDSQAGGIGPYTEIETLARGGYQIYENGIAVNAYEWIQSQTGLSREQRIDALSKRYVASEEWAEGILSLSSVENARKYKTLRSLIEGKDDSFFEQRRRILLIAGGNDISGGDDASQIKKEIISLYSLLQSKGFEGELTVGDIVYGNPNSKPHEKRRRISEEVSRSLEESADFDRFQTNQYYSLESGTFRDSAHLENDEYNNLAGLIELQYLNLEGREEQMEWLTGIIGTNEELQGIEHFEEDITRAIEILDDRNVIQIDREFINLLIDTESQWNPTVVNRHSKARGFGQFLGSTWEGLQNKFEAVVGVSFTKYEYAKLVFNPLAHIINIGIYLKVIKDRASINEDPVLFGKNDNDKASLHYEYYKGWHNGPGLQHKTLREVEEDARGKNSPYDPGRNYRAKIKRFYPTLKDESLTRFA